EDYITTMEAKHELKKMNEKERNISFERQQFELEWERLKLQSDQKKRQYEQVKNEVTEGSLSNIDQKIKDIRKKIDTKKEADQMLQFLGPQMNSKETLERWLNLMTSAILFIASGISIYLQQPLYSILF